MGRRKLIGIALLIAACAHEERPPEPRFGTEPPWVARGSGLVCEGEARSFFGVGAEQGSYSPALLASAARNQARHAVSESLAVFLNGLLEPWVEASATVEALPVAHVLATWMQASLAHVTDLETHHDPATRTVFALVELKLDDVVAAYEKTPALAPVRVHYGGRSHALLAAFDSLRGRQEKPRR